MLLSGFPKFSSYICQVVHLGQMFLFNGTFATVTLSFPSRNWNQEISLFLGDGSMSTYYLKTSLVKVFHTCGLTLRSGKNSHNDFPKISWWSSRCLIMSNKLFLSYKIWNLETSFPLCVLASWVRQKEAGSDWHVQLRNIPVWSVPNYKGPMTPYLFFRRKTGKEKRKQVLEVVLYLILWF